MDDIRRWTPTKIDASTRREIFGSPDGEIKKMYDVRWI